MKKNKEKGQKKTNLREKTKNVRKSEKATDEESGQIKMTNCSAQREINQVNEIRMRLKKYISQFMYLIDAVKWTIGNFQKGPMLAVERGRTAAMGLNC